jgi:hypothetical protein
MNDIASEEHIRYVGKRPRGRRTPKSEAVTSLGMHRHFRCSPNFPLGRKARAAFGVAGIFVGAYACLSSAAAEVEEDAGQGVGSSGYSATTLSDGTKTTFIIDRANDEDILTYLSNLNNSHGDIEYSRGNTGLYTNGHPEFSTSKTLNGFDDALIPEAVWSLDGSGGDHLDRIPGGPGTEIYTAFGGRRETTDFWASATFVSWGGDNTYKTSDLLPPQFQVASCGGSSAEHSNLAYCNNIALIAAQIADQPQKPTQNSSNSAAQQANSNGLSSSVAPASNSSAPSNVAALAPAPPAQSPLPETSSLLGPCGYPSASCTIVLINLPETLVDTPSSSFLPSPIEELTPPIEEPTPPIEELTPLIEELTPPIDPPASEAPPLSPIVFVSGPEPIVDLSLPPDPLKPIPEASTWVMTITGFAIMFLVFRKKKRSRINPISIIDGSSFCK